jgi:hypothetical protein
MSTQHRDGGDALQPWITSMVTAIVDFSGPKSFKAEGFMHLSKARRIGTVTWTQVQAGSISESDRN